MVLLACKASYLVIDEFLLVFWAIVSYGLVPKHYRRFADGETEPRGQAAEQAVGIISLIFSCLFVLELLASIWAFGFHFFRSKFHCFDATVIIASFVIDVLLRGILEEVASLVIILRLWRVFKIIEELSVGAQEQTEALHEQIELLEQEKSQLEVELTRLKSTAQESHARSL